MLGVVATLKVKPGMDKQFEAVAKELVAKVNASEPGCKLYALHHGEVPCGRERVSSLRVRLAPIWIASIASWIGSRIFLSGL